MSSNPNILAASLSAEKVRKQKDLFTMVSPHLPSDNTEKPSKFKGKTLKTQPGITCSFNSVFDDPKTCVKCTVLRRIWMFSINIYDFMGLLEICPCSTLHSVRPYMSYIKSK